ncbi:hypothetical protein RRG08_066492, partial [Elysia crispata]
PWRPSFPQAVASSPRPWMPQAMDARAQLESASEALSGSKLLAISETYAMVWNSTPLLTSTSGSNHCSRLLCPFLSPSCENQEIHDVYLSSVTFSLLSLGW